MSEPSCLASNATRGWLRRYVSPRVPACDVDDIVQATLLDAVASARAPDEDPELRRWLIAIARNKVADAHRARARACQGAPVDELECSPAFDAFAMADWASRQIPPGPVAACTLRWMVREADGEKLETIAAEEGVPPERVRKRVSRLRRWMRERWRMELAALVAVLIATTAAGRAILSHSTAPSRTAEGASDARLQGVWRLVEFVPDTTLSTARRALFDASHPSLRITFDGSHVVLATSGLERSYTVVRASDERLELADDGGNRLDVALGWDGDVLVAKLGTGPWAGSARLVR